MAKVCSELRLLDGWRLVSRQFIAFWPMPKRMMIRRWRRASMNIDASVPVTGDHPGDHGVYRVGTVDVRIADLLTGRSRMPSVIGSVPVTTSSRSRRSLDAAAERFSGSPPVALPA